MVVKQIKETCFQIDYGDVLEKEIAKLEEAIEKTREVIIDHSHQRVQDHRIGKHHKDCNRLNHHETRR